MSDDPRKYIPHVACAWAVLLLCAIALCGFFWLGSDTRMDRMLNDNHPTAQAYEHLLETYGSDEFVIVAISGKPLFEIEALDTMMEALERLEAAPHVDRVNGIPTLFRDTYGGEDPDMLHEEMMSTPFYHGLFVAPDEEAAGLMVETKVLDSPEQRQELVEGIREAAQPLADYGFRVDLVGIPVINRAINELSRSEQIKRFPIAIGASLIMLLFLLRSFRAAGVAILCGALAIAVTVGFIGLTVEKLNIVTMALPLVLWALALANVIHLVNRYQYFLRQDHSHHEALGHALQEVRRPCALSAITTAFGFVSLSLAQVLPVQEFGIFMALGMVLSLAINMLLAPHLLLWFKVPMPRGKVRKETHPYFESAGRQATKYAIPVVILFVSSMIFGGWSFTQLEGESKALTYLPQNHEVVDSYKFVADELTGMNSLELLFTMPDTWLNPEHWTVIEEVAEHFRAQEDVARVVTPLDFLKKLNQWEFDIDPEYYVLPESQEFAEELIDYLGDEELEGLTRLVQEDGKEIRMTVLIKQTPTTEFEDIIQEAEPILANVPTQYAPTMTGMSVRMHHMQEELVKTQILSFSVAFILVFTSILIGLRSIRIMLLSIVPNMMPILGAFITMYLFDIPLNAGSVMVASIALGIAVDDTVHILGGYRRNLLLNKPSDVAITNSLIEVGPSITVTAITACMAFFILGTSDFEPIAYLGLLSGIAMALAWLADIYFVPALITLVDIQKASKAGR